LERFTSSLNSLGLLPFPSVNLFTWWGEYLVVENVKFEHHLHPAQETGRLRWRDFRSTPS
jgi:hypothetical protein